MEMHFALLATLRWRGTLAGIVLSQFQGVIPHEANRPTLASLYRGDVEYDSEARLLPSFPPVIDLAARLNIAKSYRVLIGFVYFPLFRLWRNWYVLRAMFSVLVLFWFTLTEGRAGIGEIRKAGLGSLSPIIY